MNERKRLGQTDVLTANWMEVPSMPEGVNLHDPDYTWTGSEGQELYAVQTDDGPYVIACEPESDHNVMQVWKLYPRLATA